MRVSSPSVLRWRKRSRRLACLIASLCTGFALLLSVSGASMAQGLAGRDDNARIAISVLPFAGADADHSEGGNFAERLRDLLHRVEGLRVVPGERSDGEEACEDIGCALQGAGPAGASLVVVGRVGRTRSGAWSASARLIDVAQARPIGAAWSVQPGPLEALFTDGVSEIATQLLPAISLPTGAKPGLPQDAPRFEPPPPPQYDPTPSLIHASEPPLNVVHIGYQVPFFNLITINPEQGSVLLTERIELSGLEISYRRRVRRNISLQTALGYSWVGGTFVDRPGREENLKPAAEGRQTVVELSVLYEPRAILTAYFGLGVSRVDVDYTQSTDPALGGPDGARWTLRGTGIGFVGGLDYPVNPRLHIGGHGRFGVITDASGSRIDAYREAGSDPVITYMSVGIHVSWHY